MPVGVSKSVIEHMFARAQDGIRSFSSRTGPWMAIGVACGRDRCGLCGRGVASSRRGVRPGRVGAERPCSATWARGAEGVGCNQLVVFCEAGPPIGSERCLRRYLGPENFRCAYDKTPGAVNKSES